MCLVALILTTVVLAGCNSEPPCDSSASLTRALETGDYPDACVRIQRDGSGPRQVTIEWADVNHDPDINLAHAKELRNIVYSIWPEGVSEVEVLLAVGDGEAAIPTVWFGGNVGHP